MKLSWLVRLMSSIARSICGSTSYSMRTRMSQSRRKSRTSPPLAAASAARVSSSLYCRSRVSSGSSLPRQSGWSSSVGMRVSSATCRPGTKCCASLRLSGLSSISRMVPGRSWIASTRAARRGPFGSQLMLGKTKQSQTPHSCRIAVTGSLVVLRADRARDAAPGEGAHGPDRVLVAARPAFGEGAVPERLVQIPDHQPHRLRHASTSVARFL